MARVTANRPRTLHISHALVPVVDTWVERFCRADVHADSLILRADGTTAALGLAYRVTDARSGATLRHWALQDGITTTAVTHAEYGATLRQLIAEQAIDHVYVSTFAGHALDLLKVSVPVTVVYHTPAPLGIRLDVVPSHAADPWARRHVSGCLAENRFARLFEQHDVAHGRALRHAYFESMPVGVTHVCTTQDLATELRQRDKRYEALPLHVIAEGTKERAHSVFGGASEERRLRILVMGRWLTGPNLDLLRACFTRLRLVADVYFVGCGPGANFLHGKRGAWVVQQGDTEWLGQILARLAPDLAWLPAVRHGALGAALMETRLAGLPVIITRSDGHAAPMQDAPHGRVIGADPEAFLRCVTELDADRDVVRALHATLAASPPRALSDMIEDYVALRTADAPCDISLAASSLRAVPLPATRLS